MTDILIIGAGAAGMTAALYASRAGLTSLIFEGEMYGGQIITTPELENYPALPNITGADFGNLLYNQIENLPGVEFCFEPVEGASLSGKVKSVRTPYGIYEGKTVIIANGAKHRRLGVEGEDRFSGRGVSYCGTCDGAFYKGLDTAVVGGGNTAVEEALYLSNLCSKVSLIVSDTKISAQKILVDSAKKRDNIEVLFSCEVRRLYGNKKLEGAVLINTATGEEIDLALPGLFIAIGMAPENQLFSEEIALDSQGYIIAGEDCRTNVEGVFAAGDTRTKPLRQLVCAASDGAVAASLAASYLL